MRKRTYTSLQDWMERTGTTRRLLAKRAGIDESHLSKILSGSRRCSLEKALRLHEVTTVPVDNLVRWLARDTEAITDGHSDAGRVKWA
jgi:transcriptional regulator with XRE-family HTH domain